MKTLSPILIKLFSRSAPRRPLRYTLLELHTSGVLEVSRRHSLFRLWAPEREFFCGDENHAG
jgi:hypothetical protein